MFYLLLMSMCEFIRKGEKKKRSVRAKYEMHAN